jgi:hypothetical protein
MIANKFHIAIPDMVPTEQDREWAMKNIYDPFVITALNEINVRQGRIDFDQKIIRKWGMYPRVLKYFDSLGIEIRRFAAMWHRSKPRELQELVHLDALSQGIPLVARFNIPIQGQCPAVVQWWDSGFDDPNGQWRVLEKETITKDNVKKIGYGLTSDRDWKDVPWDWETESPGACWNRTELAHRMQYTGGPEARFLITVELATLNGEPDGPQVSWDTIMERNRKIYGF